MAAHRRLSGEVVRPFASGYSRCDANGEKAASLLPFAARRLFLSLLLLISCLTSYVTGQAQNRAGHLLQGQVVDQTGAVVKAARVTLSDERKRVQAVKTDEEGRFVFDGLSPGRHQMVVEAAGFKRDQRVVRVGAGTDDRLEIVLGVAPLEGDMRISGERQGLSTEAGMNANAIVLRGEMIRRLPHNERQLRRLLERLAGSFTGRLDFSVNGLSGANLPPAATIKEIRINNDPFAAAYHEPGSARVEIETKGDEGHTQASVYLNYRHSAMDARNAFSLVKPPLEYRDLGGWWSSRLFGPRSAIFGFIERQRHDESIPVIAYLPEGPFHVNVPTPSRSTLVNLRADLRPSDRQTISLLFNLDRSRWRGAEMTSLDLPERSFDTRLAEDSLQASWRATLSPRLLNEAQLRIAREWTRSEADNRAEAVEVAGAFNGGGPQCCPESRRGERFSLSDNLSFSSGRHFLRTGVSIAGVHLSEVSERDFGGTYYYASLSFFRLRRPTLYTVSAGEPHLGFGLWQFAAYVQDDLRLRPNFTISPGLRYESQTRLGDGNNFAPRLGLAWSPFKSGKTVIRSGAGIFYQQLEERQLSQALRYDGVRQRQVIVNRPRLPDPFGGRPLTSFPVSVNRLADDLRTPYQLHAAVSIEQQLPDGAILSATYNYMRGVHLFRSRDINAPLPGANLRPRPEFGRVAQLESSATATYHGLTVGFSHSYGERLSLYGYYILAREIDDADGPEAFPMDNYNLGAERGPAARDQRHQFFAGGLLVLPWGVEASPIVYFNTGRPYNITTGFDENNDSIVNDRPERVGRNSGRGQSFASMDLRLSRSFGFGPKKADQRPFAVEIAAEASNIFNRVNLTDFNGVQTSPYFGRANASHPARQITLQIIFYFH